MPTASEPASPETLRVEGQNPIRVPVNARPETLSWPVVRDSRGFECASGEWIEREWAGIPALELVEAAAMPGATTHVQLESVDGYRACVPLLDLEDALVAVGDGEGFPRFVSPYVVGPRNIKNLSRIRPLCLGPADDRERYENLPIDDK